MADRIFDAFLRNSLVEAMELADESDCLTVRPLPPLPPSHYVCVFALPYLRRLASGLVEAAAGPVLTGIHFPASYLRGGDERLALMVASVLTPDVFHPNISAAGTVCFGSRFVAGTPIGEILWHLHELLSYRVLGLDERDALNREACRLLRERPDILGLLPYRPLRRARRALTVTVNA